MKNCKDNLIDLIRGDVKIIPIPLLDKEGNFYELQEDDYLYFTVKKEDTEDNFVIQKSYDNGIIKVDKLYYILLSSNDTDKLEYGIYEYDLEFSNKEGFVSTIQEGKINLLKESTFNINKSFDVPDISAIPEAYILDLNVGVIEVPFIKGSPGKNGENGKDGENGRTPVFGVDYFTPTQVATIEAEVLAQVNQFKIEVVEELPAQNIDPFTIYLVPKTTEAENDIFLEYIYVNNSWELIGSTSVGDTVPINAIFDYAGTEVPVGYIKVEDEGEVYSTEEKRIGTWIDGKPIYRKVVVIEGSSLTAGAGNNINHGITNLNELINIEAKSLRADGVKFSLPVMPGTGASIAAWGQSITDFTDTYFSYFVGSSYTAARVISKAYAVIEYTKTTD